MEDKTVQNTDNPKTIKISAEEKLKRPRPGTRHSMRAIAVCWLNFCGLGFKRIYAATDFLVWDISTEEQEEEKEARTLSYTEA